MRKYLISGYEKNIGSVKKSYAVIKDVFLARLQKVLHKVKKINLGVLVTSTDATKNSKFKRIFTGAFQKSVFRGVFAVLGMITAFSLVFQTDVDYRGHEYVQGIDQGVGGQSLDISSLYASSLYQTKDIAFRYVDVDEKYEQILIDEERVDFENDLYAMVEGHPIEAMVPYISQQDRKVAALIVGIAKKESNWGKRSPSKNGEDCYNYWGYKGGGSRGHALGYGCFEGPEEAIDVVGGRIYELAIEAKRETPREMIIWKCGSSCAGHAPGSAEKWIQDVDIYYSRLVAVAR